MAANGAHSRLDETGLEWTDLAQDRDQYRAVVKTVMNIRVKENSGNFLNSEQSTVMRRLTTVIGSEKCVVVRTSCSVLTQT